VLPVFLLLSLQIIGYVFPKGAVINPADIQAEKLTRINYAFANVKDGKVVAGFAHDAENFAVLNGLKARNPNLKVLISVGGWTWSGAFSDAALTKASRKVFVDSAVAFVAKYKLDGVDIDWEYPGLIGNRNIFRAQDRQNYTSLMQELGRALKREGRRLHRQLYSSVATGASDAFVAHTEMAKVARAVDSVNLMSYDYYEPDSDNIAAHHAALFMNPADPKHVSADLSVKLYRAAGVPARKIVLGVPFYGHAWKVSSDLNHGLYQPGGDAHVRAGYQLAGTAGYKRYWDTVAEAPYLYNSTSHVFVSYDDPESLKFKCDYIRKQKLGGVMFWDYESDSTGALLNTLFDCLP
jgi:chitinase